MRRSSHSPPSITLKPSHCERNANIRTPISYRLSSRQTQRTQRQSFMKAGLSAQPSSTPKPPLSHLPTLLGKIRDFTCRENSLLANAGFRTESESADFFHVSTRAWLTQTAKTCIPYSPPPPPPLTCLSQHLYPNQPKPTQTNLVITSHNQLQPEPPPQKTSMGFIYENQ